MANLYGAIFDLDGTLVDSMGDIGGAMNDALVQLGFPTHTDAEFRLMVGGGVRELARKSVPEDHHHELDTIIEVYRSHYRGRMTRLTRPYAGMVQLLAHLKKQGVRLAVLSNKRDDFTKMLVDALFEKGTFQVVLGERDGVARKPDPTVALEIARELNVEPHRMAFVGDTSIDINTAKAAQMVPFAVSWGFRSKEELSVFEPHYLAETMEQLSRSLSVFFQRHF